jgi:hypothetical protein
MGPRWDSTPRLTDWLIDRQSQCDFDFDLTWWFYLLHLIHTQLGPTGNTALRWSTYTFQFIVTHALGFSVFTSRILATDLSKSHCNSKSHMEFSLHSLIPFLPLFCSRQLNSVPSSNPGRLASRNSTLHLRLLLLFYPAKDFLVTTLHGPRRKHSLYC